MSWFKRIKEGITTSTKEKKETPEGLWYKCPSCKNISTSKDHMGNMYVCVQCGYHDRIGSEEYF
ncbi:MAG: acetyl-CoA carboxylase carboxyl transferase subunit beta, partial [Bacteroidia bacterium]|nr:acetyl-CoA carboxylase carboxyl transferase subunit beta [Bacteroidia bacterium]